METITSPLKVSASGNDCTPVTAVRHFLTLDGDAARGWIEECTQRLPVDEFLPLLKDESERHLNSDPRVARRLAEALMFAGEAADRPEYRALGLMAMGDVFGVLGRYEESVAAVDEAAALYQSLGDEIGWARTRKEWLRSSYHLGRGEAALAVAEQARDILARHRVWRRAAVIDYCIGDVCAQLGKFTEALSHYDRAQSVFDSLGAAAELQAARQRSNKAILLTELGEFPTALRLYEEIRPVYLRHNQTLSALRQEHNVAHVHAAQGHYTRALRTCAAVLAAFEQAGLEIEAVFVAIDMIECYLNLNRNQEARELAEETIARAEHCGAQTEAARAQFFCALAHAQLGDTEQAAALLDAAARAFASTGLSTQVALATLERATFNLADAQWSLALDGAEQAGALFAERGLTIRQAQADLVRARASFALGDSEIATHLAHAALATSDARDIRWLAHTGHHLLGDIARSRGDLDAALVAYDDAIVSIEQMQSALAIELRTHFLADKLRVYEDAIAVCLRREQPERAFAYLERAKSRALVDYLASNIEVQIKGHENADEALLETLARLREEHNWFYNRLYGYGFSGDQGGPSQSDDALRAAIADRERQIARILDRLALDRTEGLGVAVAPAEQFLPPTLDAGTILLEYYLTSDDVIVFVASSAGLAVVSLAVRPSEIRRLLHQWQLNLAAAGRMVASGMPLDGLGRNARGILGALYRALLAPVATHLAEHARLIVVPYGPLHAVPFHALHDGERYVIEVMAVSVSPSSSLLRLGTERPRPAARSALVVSYSDGGRLPAVRDEAEAVAALIPGECFSEAAATRGALASAAPRHRILHLAAHGEARLDNPTFAHLKLADGQLSMVDIFNLPLQGALVTLSACETGRSVVAGGDELIGLSRGFLYAGAATLVQSLWRVEDGSTARLMRHFYGGIRAGSAAGVALREAQRALLAESGAHPFSWAPFQLVGDWGYV
ncbi:MAG: CHAT domain-containing protein [Thermomicrobiales bacterium]